MKKVISRILVVLILISATLFMTSCEVKIINENQTNESIITSNSNIKNIILIIGDGMGVEHVSAGSLCENKEYAFTNWDYVNVNTDSVNTEGLGPVKTDSAAAGTALATGKLTVNGYIGKDYEKTDVTTILDEAKLYGKSTGIVTTDKLYGATPAAFSSHSDDRNSRAEIIKSQIKSGVNLLCGAYSSTCASYLDKIQTENYAYCTDYYSIDDTMTSDKAYWQLDLYGIDASIQLKQASLKAISFLNRDEDGFVLIIEQAHIDKYSHNNDFDGMVKSVKSLNDTVEAIIDWIGDRNDTAVLITSDHETGGLTVSKEARYAKSYEIDNRTIYYNFSTTSHTNSKVGLYTYGINVNYSMFNYYTSDHLIKNINVYDLMCEILKKEERPHD